MKKLISFLFVLSMLGMAGHAKAEDQGGSQDTSTVWVEFHFGANQNGGFKDRIEDQSTKDVGLGIALGFQPLKKFVKQADPAAVAFLKNLGIYADVNLMPGPSFPNYLYSTETRTYLTQDEIDQYCYTSYGHWNNRCAPCGDYIGSGVCSVHTNDIYGRDTYVKYSNGSFAVGMYLPIEVAKKFLVEPGVNVRFHSIVEGIQTDELDTSLKTSLNVQIRVAWKADNHWSLGAKIEKSVKGFEGYKSIMGSVAYKFGNN